MNYAALSHLLVLLFASGAAFAWDPLGIEPVSPTANQLVSVVMGTGGCDALPSTDGFPQISQTGQDIRILFYGVRATDPEFCVYPNGQYAYAVGHYPAGNYSLRIDVVYEHFPFGLETVTLATIPFSVSGSPAATPVAAPALDGTSLALLATLVAAVAAMTFDADRYRLYRVFAFRERPRVFDLPGAISQNCMLDAVSYLATPGESSSP